MTTAAPPVAPPLAGKTRVLLSGMMFLQYAIWGAWLPLLYPFLNNHRGFSDAQIGHMFMVGAVGALVAPFIAGQIADRLFSTERFLAISHLVGAVLVWQLAVLESYGAFLVFSLFYSLVYSPTLPLTNSLSFHHLPDRDRDFGQIRLWGTVGWIAAGIGIGQWLLHHHADAVHAGMADAFKLSAVLGGLMGVFCFFLPHTPPSKEGEGVATFAALDRVRVNPLLTLFLLAVPISCIHQFYFVHTAGFLGAYQSEAADSINQIFGVGGGGLMTLGQMSEILVLGAVPFVAKHVSRKLLLGIGIAAYALRMAIFAYLDALPTPATATLMFGVALHGLCFGCFIFVAFMVVDEETPLDVRASAQSLFNLVIIGIGIIVGSYLATGVVGAWAKGPDGATDYTKLFSVPMWASLACLAALLVFYPGGRRRPEAGVSTTS